MKSQIYKWMALVAMLISLVFVVTNATAKKPPKNPPPDGGDTCSELAFSPDFAFWRYTGKRKAPKNTIFLAESNSGCEKSLVDFPLGDFADIRNLKFSSVENDNYYGRVVWSSKHSTLGTTIWKQDFYIDGVNVNRIGVPKQIMHDGSSESDQDVRSIDLSHDTNMLAFALSINYEDEDAPTVHSIRVINVESCLESSCPFDSALGQELPPSNMSGYSWNFYSLLTWGPIDYRLYVTRNAVPDLTAIQYYDFNSDWSGVTAHILFSSFDYPEYTGVLRRPASGMRGPNEILAIAIKEDPSVVDRCSEIYEIDVAACEANLEACKTEPLFAGTIPSWTKAGILVHQYGGWTNKGWCSYTGVGLWTGDSLESPFDGQDPDAAGGFTD